MKCGSDQHLIRDCKLEPVTSNGKNAKKDNQLKPKDIEKKVAAVREVDESILQKHVSAVQSGKIFNSKDKDTLDWGLD